MPGISRALSVAACCLLPVTAAAQLAYLLKATPSSQLNQNRHADRDDLSRMRDTAMIQRFYRNKLLVRVPASTRTYYLRSIPTRYRYLRPWSKLFLERLSGQFHARFGKRLRVTSLVRTVALQQALARRNGNAAAAYGPRRSTHLTGATLDISKRNLTTAERNWLRRVLHSLKQKGHLDAVEEYRQPTFHIMVHRGYVEYVKRITGGRNAD